MPIEIRASSPEWGSAVREFNGRLDAAGAEREMRLPEHAQAGMLPGSETWLAVENGAVRGGYTLRPQQFSIRGEVRRVAHYRLPVSEGIIDKRYALVGSLLLRSALQREPRLYALGMGGCQQPLPRMLHAAGWNISATPFYFRVVHAGAFLRQIRGARQAAWRAGLMDLAAWSGVGSLGIHTAQRFRTRGSGPPEFKVVDDFGSWADEVWESSHRAYCLIARRDAEVLQQLYPPASERFLRIRTSGGWAVLVDTAMRDDRYFGDLRVGTIVDCLAKPENAGMVVCAARRYLERRGVDLIVTNQAHPTWIEALQRDGFLRGPSNFLFAASPALNAAGAVSVHINRGDGDGPVHL